jgi:hypothetical protein
MEKLFTIAGFSTLNGKVKLRVATGTVARRLRVLQRNAHTDITLQELPEAMTRKTALEFLIAQSKATAN